MLWILARVEFVYVLERKLGSRNTPPLYVTTRSGGPFSLNFAKALGKAWAMAKILAWFIEIACRSRGPSVIYIALWRPRLRVYYANISCCVTLLLVLVLVLLLLWWRCVNLECYPLGTLLLSHVRSLLFIEREGDCRGSIEDVFFAREG